MSSGSSANPVQPRVAVPTSTATTAQYTLRFTDAARHFIDVEATYPARGRTAIEVMMPVWTPGSYLVREYARHVEDFRVGTERGALGQFEKISKNRFRLIADAETHFVLRYRIYARERSVRTNFVDIDHAVITPAATFFVDVDHRDEPHRIVVEPHDGWPDIAVALPRASTGTASSTYVAENFDDLMDAPLLIGRLDRRAFEVAGVEHELVTFGGGDVWDAARAVEDTKRMTKAIVEFWGGPIPYDRYLFLNVLNEHRGGLEHRASTVLMASAWISRDEERYRGWTGLVAHELFHAWNGKRLRPVSLGPFDYEAENYVRTLWVVEG
ncbi:MAG: peptidase M61, partial [Myxococcota bacterium]